jgi:hypothetical protein
VITASVLSVSVSVVTAFGLGSVAGAFANHYFAQRRETAAERRAATDRTYQEDRERVLELGGLVDELKREIGGSRSAYIADGFKARWGETERARAKKLVGILRQAHRPVPGGGARAPRRGSRERGRLDCRPDRRGPGGPGRRSAVAGRAARQPGAAEPRSGDGRLSPAAPPTCERPSQGVAPDAVRRRAGPEQERTAPPSRRGGEEDPDSAAAHVPPPHAPGCVVAPTESGGSTTAPTPPAADGGLMQR